MKVFVVGNLDLRGTRLRAEGLAVVRSREQAGKLVTVAEGTVDANGRLHGPVRVVSGFVDGAMIFSREAACTSV